MNFNLDTSMAGKVVNHGKNIKKDMVEVIEIARSKLLNTDFDSLKRIELADGMLLYAKKKMIDGWNYNLELANLPNKDLTEFYLNYDVDGSYSVTNKGLGTFNKILTEIGLLVSDAMKEDPDRIKKITFGASGIGATDTGRDKSKQRMILFERGLKKKFPQYAFEINPNGSITLFFEKKA